MLATAFLVLAGQDLAFEDRLTALGASGPVAIGAQVDDAPATGPAATGGGSGSGLPALVATSLPGPGVLEDLGPAPEFVGIDAWINAQPQTMASLRARLVLVEFWTFACINCIHVQPYVKAWADRYADAGLVVIGVHTPELSFERDLGNVRDAVAKAGIRPIPSPSTRPSRPGTPTAIGTGRRCTSSTGTGASATPSSARATTTTSEQVIRQLLTSPG